MGGACEAWCWPCVGARRAQSQTASWHDTPSICPPARSLCGVFGAQVADLDKPVGKTKRGWLQSQRTRQTRRGVNKTHPRSLVHDARVELGAARASPRRHGASHPQAVPRPAVARSVSSGRRRPPHQAATPSHQTKPPHQAIRPSHQTIIPRRQTKPPPQVTAHDARGPTYTSSTQPPLPSRR